MTVCMQGSGGNTLNEMLSVLYPSNNNKQPLNLINARNEKTKQILKLCDYYNKEYGAGNKDKPVIKLANKVWIEMGYGNVLDSYRKAIREENIEFVDTTNPKEAAAVVNKWCADATNGMIDNVVTESVMENMHLLIANAIYFNGKFDSKFPEDNTAKNVNFYADKNRKKVISNNISMMYQFSTLHYMEEYEPNNGEMYDVVRLTYKGSNLSLILSINSYSIRNTLLLKEKDIKSMKWEYGELNLFVPKFKYEFQLQLNGILSTMGINDAFDKKADFSHMASGIPLKIDSVIHKAMIEVNEEGTKAAAVTYVEMDEIECDDDDDEDDPPTIRFDHPFSFYIFDEKNQIILFSGVYNGSDSSIE